MDQLVNPASPLTGCVIVTVRVLYPEQHMGRSPVYIPSRWAYV